MNVAIVGTGYIAGRHAEVLANEDNCVIVAHVDVTIEGAQKAADAWGGRAYNSIDTLLDNEQVDAAWICVPPFVHGDIERKFVTKGIPMYIEKPVANDMQTAEDINAFVREHEGFVTVGYYWRCMEIVHELQRMLQETPPRFVRAAWHGVTPAAPWWQKRAMSGGQIVEQATHQIDFLRYTIGEARVLHAAGNFYERQDFPAMDTPTSTVATLQFDNGIIGVVTATCVLDGTRDANVEYFCDGRKITVTREEMIVENSNGRVATPIGTDPLALADRNFLRNVAENNRSQLFCPYDEALKTQQLCYDIQLSVDTFRGE